MHFGDILTSHRRNLLASKQRPDMALDQALDLCPRPRPVPLLDVFGDVTVKQIVDERRVDIGAPHGHRIRLIIPNADAYRLEEPLGLLASAVGRDLAMLADRHPARAALLVAILHQIGANAARQHAQAKPRDFVIENHLIGRCWLYALDKSLRQFRHSFTRSVGRLTDSNGRRPDLQETRIVARFWTAWTPRTESGPITPCRTSQRTGGNAMLTAG